MYTNNIILYYIKSRNLILSLTTSTILSKTQYTFSSWVGGLKRVMNSHKLKQVTPSSLNTKSPKKRTSLSFSLTFTLGKPFLYIEHLPKTVMYKHTKFLSSTSKELYMGMIWYKATFPIRSK